MKIFKIQLVVIILFQYTFVFSQTISCDNLRAEDSKVGYRALDDRCEGYYVPKYAGNLQFVSFTLGRISYTWDKNTFLHASLPEGISEVVNIRGVSLPRNINYRMDTYINPGIKNEYSWPVDPFIYNDSNGITHDKLGIYGWNGNKDDKTFIPVILVENGKLPDSDSIILKFRPTAGLSHFRYTFFESDAQNSCRTDIPITEKKEYKGDMFAGSIIEIVLPNTKMYKGRKCLEIRYRVKNEKWDVIYLNIYTGE